ncbi:MAG: hypothetical protein ABFR75_06535 [Acidobacteriota bacterium]
MDKTRNETISKILTPGGFITYFFNYPVYSPLLILPFIFFIFNRPFSKKDKQESYSVFFPYSSGLLIFILKLFYWGKYDLSIRIKYLLILSLVLTIFLIIKKNKSFDKFIKGFNSLKLKNRLITIFIFTEIIFIIVSGVLVIKGVELVGDEPHYLAISHSIAKDGDINVFNQYARDEYREFINYRLQHHTKVGKGFKKWYSFHLPGLSLTMAPFFLFKLSNPLLYFLIRSFLGIFGSLLAVMVYLISLKVWKKGKLSFFIYGVFTFTAPVFFYSIHIFAEAQVLLFFLISIYLGLLKEGEKGKNALWAGFFLGITVFWGMKYLIFISIFSFIFFIYKFREKKFREGFSFVLFPVFFVFLFFVYLWFAYGSFSPMSVYTGVLTEAQRAEYNAGMESITLQNRIETLFDYFFDQRDGLLLYNPFYFFFFPGLIIALIKFRKYYPFLIVSIASFIYLLYHGYSTVRPGYCPQARYLLPVIWTLMLFSVIYYIESRNKLFKRLFVILPFLSFFVTIYQIFNPFTLYQSTTHNYLDRSGLLFQKLSNVYMDLSNFLPSFIKVEGNEKYLPNIIFLVIFAGLIVLSLKSIKREGFGRGFFISILILFFILSLFPRVSLYNPVKVKTEAGVSFLVHGNPYPKGDILGEYVMEIRDSSKGIITISTIKKVKGINFYLSGHPTWGKVTLTGFNRDHEIFALPKDQGRNIKIINPGYKKIKGRYFYTFNFKLCYRIVKSLNIKVEPY